MNSSGSLPYSSKAKMIKCMRIQVVLAFNGIAKLFHSHNFFIRFKSVVALQGKEQDNSRNSKANEESYLYLIFKFELKLKNC